MPDQKCTFTVPGEFNACHSPVLYINKLTLDVHLGWPDAEREKTQPVYLDMIINFNQLTNACSSDDLQDTICYQTLITQLRAHLQQSSYRLIEHLGYVIYHFTKKSLPTTCSLQIVITKYPNIAGLLQGVSFSYGDLTRDV
jgi:7,8-dihydroneopterin aldolase/epimerase/oxygenase